MTRIVTTAILISCSALAGPAFDVLTVPRPTEGTRTRYLINGQRVGTGFEQLAPGTFESKPAMVWTADLEMRVTAGDQLLARKQHVVKYFEPVLGGRLLGFEASEDRGAGPVATSGRVVGDQLEITTPAGRKKIPLPKERLEVAELPRLAAFQRTKLKAWTFDAVELREFTIEFAFVSEAAVGTAHHLTVKGPDGTLTFDQRGAFISANNGPLEGVPLLAGDDATEPVFDTSAASIALPRQLADDAPRLAFVFSGLSRDQALVVPRRQTTEVLPNGRLRIEVVRVEPALPQKISPDWPKQPELQQALIATDTLDLEKISAFARKAARGEKNAPVQRNAWVVTLALGAAVNKAVRLDSSISNGKASATLTRGVGNVHDRNALFIALARANGIPARATEGLCSFPGQQLFPTTWAEVFVGEWVPYNVTMPAGVAPAHCIALKSAPFAGGISVELE